MRSPRSQFPCLAAAAGLLTLALYGVTAGDDAVSHVVSLRLADLPEVGSEERGVFAGAIR